jgi:hypothetical protein
MENTMEVKADTSSRDDELLSAMLDGELDEVAAIALKERLAGEPQLAKRLATLRRADDQTRAMFATIDELPMPQGVIDLLAANGASEALPASNVISFPRRMIDRFASAPVAIAASVALAAGFFANRLFEGAPTAPASIAVLQAQTVPQGSAVYELLENNASAEPVDLADGATGRVLLTFADENGDWCRQLAIESNDASVQALACRRSGDWRSEVIAFGNPAAGAYQPASAAALAIISAAVDSRIGDRAALEADEERQLLNKQWLKKP